MLVGEARERCASGPTPAALDDALGQPLDDERSRATPREAAVVSGTKHAPTAYDGRIAATASTIASTTARLAADERQVERRDEQPVEPRDGHDVEHARARTTRPRGR